MTNRTSYTLKAVHQSFDDDEHEINTYERVLHVEVLKTFEATFYDPNLKMHFEDKKNSWTIYEVETDNVQVSLCSRMKKAEDLIRRVNYLYDWIQIKVNNKGRALSVENKDELRSTWKELKETIEGDYEGGEVEKYLSEIDLRFKLEEAIAEPLIQYYYFGLLFPGILVDHGNKWKTKRLVEFSEYEKEKFEECIEYLDTTDGINHFQLTGNCLPESELTISKYTGLLSCPADQLLPEKATLEIIFSFAEHTNQWNFELNRITPNQ